MERSLEVIAASGVDIVPRFFERFHAVLPGQRERFYNARSSQGQMVNEMVAMMLALASGESWLPTMLRASVNTHHDHGEVNLDHYRITIGILLEILREAAGSGWGEEFERAWQTQADGLLCRIESYF